MTTPTPPASGIDLDLAIHVRVMGGDPDDVIPFYAVDPAAAWAVVERLIEDGWGVRVAGDGLGNVYAEVSREWPRRRGRLIAPTMPEAVARAALAALEA